MRRLVTLLLCLLTASGARSGFAAASQNATEKAGTALAALSHPAAHGTDPAPAADPAWTAPEPVVLAPAARGIAPHAVRQPGAPFARLAPVAAEAATARGQSAAARLAGLAVVRRGYRATGPPGRRDMSLFTQSLAQPA